MSNIQSHYYFKLDFQKVDVRCSHSFVSIRQRQFRPTHGLEHGEVFSDLYNRCDYLPMP